MSTTILVNEKSVESNIFKHLVNAHQDASVYSIKTNTQATDHKHNIVSMSWKNRAKQKKHMFAVLHRNSSWTVDCNGRSTDFLPGNMIQSGCPYLCSYCYLDRHGPSYLKFYDDYEKFVSFCMDLEKNQEHYRKKFITETGKDFEKYRDVRHNKYITVDIGCDDNITQSNRATSYEGYNGHVVELVNCVNDNTKDIMLSFASKDADFTDYAPSIKNPERCRIRLSLMPEHHRQVLELNTSKIEDRIKSINYLVDMGFEVHINLSPVVVTENFAAEYSDLLNQINEGISQKAKDQMAYEIIFVTHDNVVNEEMSQHMPKAYDMIVNGPCSLEKKWNKKNVFSYSPRDKDALKALMHGMIDDITPYSRIRYMF